MPLRNPFKKKRGDAANGIPIEDVNEGNPMGYDQHVASASARANNAVTGGQGRLVEPLNISQSNASSEDNFKNNPSTPSTIASPTDSEGRGARSSNMKSFDIEKNGKETETQYMDGGDPVDSDAVTVNEDYNLMIDGKPVYVVKQKRGYLSIGFSVAQVIILIAMMIQCSVAPMNINPMVGPYPDALSYWGGKNSWDILYEHEYWRLFSPIMLHAGIFHLICNVAVQLDTGAFFEREWGSVIWLTVYLGSAAAGSILSVIVTPNSIGVGSSGSVCGLFGAKIAEALCRSRESKKNSQKELSHAILCEQFGSTLCSVILILVFSFIPYVDWAAHMGGLMGGFVVGLMIFSLKVKTFRWKIGLFAFGFLFALIGFSTGVLHMIQETKAGVAQEMEDVCGYYMNYFPDYECNCMLGRHQEQDGGDE